MEIIKNMNMHNTNYFSADSHLPQWDEEFLFVPEKEVLCKYK